MIWITRPKHDASILSSLLQSNGYETYVEPLLEIKFKKVDLDLSNCQAIAFTSLNGVRAYNNCGGRKDLPVFAVGKSSAEEARRSNFKDIFISGGDVIKLSNDIKANLDSKNGAIYHPSGSVVARDLQKLLSGDGFSVKRQVIYESIKVNKLSRELLDLIALGKIKCVIIMSERTLDVFINLVKAYLLDSEIKNMLLCVLNQRMYLKLNIMGISSVVINNYSFDELLITLNKFKM